MNRLQFLVMLAALVLIAAGCQTEDDGAQAFTLSDPDIDMAWVLTRDHELACGAPEMAGGEIEGSGTFGDLGRLDVAMSAAWDIGAANPDPDQAEYEPQSPDAGGPFAPVLGQSDYPYAFQANPFATNEADACDPTVEATGQLILTTPGGDQLAGNVTGGETHRLDVQQEGDGIEVFAEIAFDGGTGQFADARGSAVLHLITHFDFAAGAFVIDEIEVLAGGTVQL